MWVYGTISAHLGRKILILIPKGNEDTQGIGLLEVLWKVIEDIIDTLIKKEVMFHEALHRFCAGRGFRIGEERQK